MGGWLASYLRGLPESLTHIYATLYKKHLFKLVYI